MNLIIDDHNEAELTVSDDNDISLGASDTINIAVKSYNKLEDKPQIEGVELVSNKSLSDIGAYSKSEVDAIVQGKADESELSAVAKSGKYDDLTNKPNLFSGNYNDLTNKPTIPTVPTKVSAFTNDVGYMTSYTETDPTVPQWAKAQNKPTYTASEVGALPSTTVIPSKTSDLNNDSGFITDEDIPTIPSKTSDLTNDSGFITGMTILSYGNSTWNDFITAYNAKKVVYCRASSGSNPASGSQTRLAFMAYVNNAETPTEVEFQYYRSMSSLSDSQQGDQVFVYKITSSGSWTVTTRNAFTKMVAGSGLTSTYNNGTLTMKLDGTLPTKTSDLDNDSNFTNKTYVDGTSGRVYYGQVDSTSTATVFTATIDGITEYYDGLTIMLKNGVVTSASGFTININGLGAKHAYSNMAAATAETTMFNVNYTMMFTYDSTRVEGGGWILYRGYNSNDNTIGYQIRSNSMSLPMTSVTYRYRLLFTSADRAHFVPANNSTSTNATAKRDTCQDKIDPFGRIVYYGTTASVAAGSRPSVTALWDRYTIALGYSFNRTGAALTLTSWKPVYLKCAPQTDGSAIIDADEPYVQELPTTADGKIYIHLGVAYSATNIELNLEHPVYYHDGTIIRMWTGPTA